MEDFETNEYRVALKSKMAAVMWSPLKKPTEQICFVNLILLFMLIEEPGVMEEDTQLDNQVSVVVTGSKLERLAMECQKPEFQAPCKPGQKWQCIADGNRWDKQFPLGYITFKDKLFTLHA